MFPIKRGFVKAYNQDTLDIWLLRDGIRIVYDHRVKDVSKILHDLGWRARGPLPESIAFEDKVNEFLFLADKHYLKPSGQYDFTSDAEAQEAVQLLVEDMNAVLDGLGHEIEFGTGTYTIKG